MKIYLLCQCLPDHGQFEVLGWCADRVSLEMAMFLMELEHHEKAAREAVGKGYKVLSLSETSHRNYFIEEVEQFPLQSGAVEP